MPKQPGQSSTANINDLESLIAKRLDQGLSINLISQRLGLPTSTVSLIVAEIKRRKNMTVTERIGELRNIIRPKDMKAVGFRAGQQTHDYQDAARVANEHLDALDETLAAESEDKNRGGKR